MRERTESRCDVDAHCGCVDDEWSSSITDLPAEFGRSHRSAHSFQRNRCCGVSEAKGVVMPKSTSSSRP